MCRFASLTMAMLTLVACNSAFGQLAPIISGSGYRQAMSNDNRTLPIFGSHIQQANCHELVDSCNATDEPEAYYELATPFGTDGTGATCCSDGSCGSCSHCQRSSTFRIFGESLFVRPRDFNVAYAVPVDGPVIPALGNGIQVGPIGVSDPDYQNAFRVGFAFDGFCTESLMATWTHFQSHSTDAIAIGAPDVIRSLVTHPLGANAASDGLQATADYDIDFDYIDIDAAFSCGLNPCNWCTKFLLGLRYGDLNQEFTSTIDVNGRTIVDTDIDFVGVGPRVGLVGNRTVGNLGGYFYGLGTASILVGESKARYRQEDAFSGVLVDTTWEAARIAPVLDAEIGIGWSRGRLNLRAGYMISAWFNTVNTSEFINAVQANSPDDLGSNVSFDGLVARIELTF